MKIRYRPVYKLIRWNSPEDLEALLNGFAFDGWRESFHRVPEHDLGGWSMLTKMVEEKIEEEGQ